MPCFTGLQGLTLKRTMSLCVLVAAVPEYCTSMHAVSEVLPALPAHEALAC